MFDEIQSTPAPSETPEPVANEPIHLPDDHPLVKTLAAQKEQLRVAKEQIATLAPKASRLDEIEEANKTELQKAQEALAAAEERATKAEAARLRADIARTSGVDPDLLTGSDEESLNQQVQKLLAWKGEPAPAAPPAPSSSGPASPSGAAPIRTFTNAQIAAMSPEEYQANRADILAAQAAGLITL